MCTAQFTDVAGLVGAAGAMAAGVLIAIIVIPIIVLVFCIVLCVCCCLQSQKRQQASLGSVQMVNPGFVPVAATGNVPLAVAVPVVAPGAVAVTQNTVACAI